MRTAGDFLKMHEYSEGRAAPPLRDVFVSYLDRPRAGHTQPPLLTIPQAWDRLRVEHPRAADAVYHTVIHKLTLREAAPHLQCSFKTVGTLKNTGVTHLAAWTGLLPLAVTCQLARHVSAGIDTLHK